uniref:Putative regulator component n=1 Tax=Streptomyces sp. NRRL 30471 TaxID=996287 RepID=F2WUE8_9ACTN|nr:putative regulator component [Streptomyces sp. NRRL 30471]
MSGACGLLLATSTDDHIFYEQRTGRLHQEHIVLHEIGHLLFDHRTINLSEDAGRSILLPDLDPRLVQRLLARSNYDTQQEQEAELLASLIRTRVLRREPEAPSGVLGKLEAALGVRSSRGE